MMMGPAAVSIRPRWRDTPSSTKDTLKYHGLPAEHPSQLLNIIASLDKASPSFVKEERTATQSIPPVSKHISFAIFPTKMNIRAWKPSLVPASTHHLQFAGFFTTFLIPLGIFMYAVRDPASVAEARKRADRRRVWIR